MNDYKTENKVCLYCGKPLKRHYNTETKMYESMVAYSNRKYCNKTCCYEAKKARQRKQELPKPITCAQCGKEFVPCKDSDRLKFCSKECYLLNRKETAYLKKYVEKNKERLSEYNKSAERKNKRNQDRRDRYKEDVEYRERTKAKVKEYNIKNPQAKLKQHLRKYDLSIEQYNEMFNQQNGKCAICNDIGDDSKLFRPLYIDHNHTTGKVRGLLCQRCNFMIGQARDSIEILSKGIEYLKHYE